MNAPEPSDWIDGGASPDGSAGSSRCAPAAGNSSARAALLSGPDDATVIRKALPVALTPDVVSPQSEIRNQLVGERLGQYDILEYIGGGGMGAVYRALDTNLNRQVALKLLAREPSHDDETVKRFRNEAQSAARLDHDNIARVYSIGEDRGLHYIAFEYIDGVTIRRLVQEQGALPIDDAVSYTVQVAEALAHASDRDVVHRDIKPSNIVVMPNGRAKLVDMGLARVRSESHDGSDLTASGVTLGTFDYISPEQARDPRVADVRSDLYSLGCTVYFMLTGQPPFPEGTVLQKLLQHQGDRPEELVKLNPDLPEGLCLIVQRLMAKDPRRRYQTPAELLSDLALFSEAMGWDNTRTAGARDWLRPRPLFTRLERHVPWLAPLLILFFVVGLIAWQSPRRSSLLPPLTVAQGDYPSRRFEDEEPESAPNPKFGGPRSPRPAVAGESSSNSGDARPRPSPSNTGDLKKIPSPRDVAERTASPNPEKNRGSKHSDGAAALPGVKASDLAGIAEGDRDGPSALADPGPGRIHDEPAVASTGAANEPDADERAPSAVDKGPTNDAAGATGSNSAANPPTNTSPPATTADSAPPPAAMLNVRIVDPTGSGPHVYPTLKAACADAKNNDVIELRFDGRLEEPKPIRLDNKQLTIRARDGFHPVLAFRPTESDPLAYPRSMILVSGGRLNLVNVSVELDVPRSIRADRWALFEAQQVEQLRIERSTLTIRNAADEGGSYASGVAFIDVTAPSVTAMMMETSAGMAPQTVDIDVQHSVMRGEAVVLKSDPAQSVSFSWQNGLAAVSEQFVFMPTGMSPPKHPGKTLVRLRHVTARVDGGFVRIAGGNPRHHVPLEVQCVDSVLLARREAPVVQLGPLEPDLDDRRGVVWSGSRNFYDGFAAFFRVMPSGGALPPQDWALERWLDEWGPGEELFSTWGIVGWKNPPEVNRPTHANGPQNYALSDEPTIENPARGSASDARDAGAELGQLPPDSGTSR